MSIACPYTTVQAATHSFSSLSPSRYLNKSANNHKTNSQLEAIWNLGGCCVRSNDLCSFLRGGHGKVFD